MGIISDVKSVGAIQKIKNGGIAKLSVSQIVNVLINLPDAAKKLSNTEYIKVHELYKEMRKSTIQIPMNMDMYLDTAVKIILEFDKIAPYEKYSGGGETEYSFMMADIYGDNWETIKELREKITSLEQQIEENDAAYTENSKILKEAFSDDDLKRMVASGEFPADRVDEYIEQRENLACIIKAMPTTRKLTADFANELRKQLAELQDVEQIKLEPVHIENKAVRRYCRYCGGAIDLQTQKCNGCGKQYFRIKIRMRHVVTALIIACLIALNIFQFFQFWELSSQDRFYDDIVEALSSDDLGAATNTFKASRNYIIVGADEQDRRFTLTAHNLDEDSITVSYSSDAATVSFDEDEWKKKVNVEVIPHQPGVTVVTFEDDKSGKSFEFLIIVTD